MSTKKKHLNIVLANAPIKNGNMGCVALTITMLDIIDVLMKEMGVGYDVYLPDSGWKNCDLMEYSALNRSYKYHVCDYYRHVDLKTTLKKKIRSLSNPKGFKRVFKKADVILDIGQGDSFSDIYGKYRFDCIDLIHSIARELHKPYCILPQTIGPFKDVVIKARADKSIADATLCLVRDQQSFKYVKENVPTQTSLKECIDVAFFMPYEKMSFSKEYVHVGLNVSSLLWHGGYNRNNQFGLKSDYPETINKIIEFFLSRQNVKLHLIPHVVSELRGIENDYEVSYELWRKYNSSQLVLAPFAFGPMEIKSYISGMDFFMGARMHSTIGAFSAGVPVVPMAYSRKFNGLFMDTLDYPYIVDLKMQKQDEILNVIEENFENREKTKTVVESRMNGMVKNRGEIFRDELKKFFYSLLQ